MVLDAIEKTAVDENSQETIIQNICTVLQINNPTDQSCIRN